MTNNLNIKEYSDPIEWSKLYTLNKYQILQRHELKEFSKTQNIFGSKNPCNIYMIIRRAKVIINPNYLQLYENIIELEFYIYTENGKRTIRQVFFLPYDFNSITNIIVAEPYDYLNLVFSNNTTLKVHATVILDILCTSHYYKLPELDDEILYVGQAINKKDNLETKRRLLNHTTYNKIIEEQKLNYHKYDVWIMLCSFTEKNFTEACFYNSNNDDDEFQIKKELEMFTKKRSPLYLNFEKKERVNLIEAALINYFKPKYNENFKYNFPDTTHTSYLQAFKKEINQFIIEIDTSDLKRKFYSEVKERKEQHIIQYDFTFDNSRYKQFQY